MTEKPKQRKFKPLPTEHPSEKPLKLNDKQEMFCREYLVDLNATQAAIRAGYSQKTAGQIGEQLLKKLEIQSFIDELKSKRIERVVIESDDVLRELIKLAKSDIRTIWNESGVMKPMEEWPDEIAACVASVQVDEIRDAEGAFVGYTRKVKFWDKTKSLEMLGRHLKMFTDNIAVAMKPPNIIDDIPR